MGNNKKNMVALRSTVLLLKKERRPRNLTAVVPCILTGVPFQVFGSLTFAELSILNPELSAIYMQEQENKKARFVCLGKKARRLKTINEPSLRPAGSGRICHCYCRYLLYSGSC
jgi:hypothetical protein